MSKYNIIGDIAGEYDTLMALLNNMPKGYVLSVGDLCDRGSKSKEVIDFFIAIEKEGTGNSLFGNHEHMLVDYIQKTEKYGRNIYLNNGGQTTLSSFSFAIPNQTVDWLACRPLFKIIPTIDGDIFVAHSFINMNMNLAMACDDVNSKYIRDIEQSLIWNRNFPIYRKEYILQIAGHNSNWGLKYFENTSKLFALGIDTSAKRVLTGIVIDTDLSPTRENIEVYQQPYV